MGGYRRASVSLALMFLMVTTSFVVLGVVWYLMSGRIGGAGSRGVPATEEVEEEPETSDVEREFEELEKEM